MKQLRLRSVAKSELRDATAWYAERSNEVAERFIAEEARTFALIEKFPMTGGAVPGVPDADIRRLPVHNFPYHVVFLRLPDRVTVLAIAHDRRKPGYWR